MRITRFHARNYRTLENLTVEFPSYYSAICGRNDSGKTNVVRALRCLMKEDETFYVGDQPEFSIKNDYTRWGRAEPKERAITVEVDLEIDERKDTGLFRFFVDYLKLDDASQLLRMTLRLTHRAEQNDVLVRIGDAEFRELQAQEVLKRLQTSRTFLFHSSTDPRPAFVRGFRGVLGEVADEHAKRLDAAQKRLDNALKRVAKDRQQDLQRLLGRLADHYRVSLSIPTFEISYFPYELTLGDTEVEISLDDWGSGTRNRTMVLLTILRARQVAESPASASKVTPIIVIEEPESFLHPLAQAEFGRVLQELADEFEVQLIVTTHSPYLLSRSRPDCNVLLRRKVTYRKLRATELVDTSGEHWMEPYASALGLRAQEFEPWRTLFFSRDRAVLLVEGETDKAYFELLRREEHGAKRLSFSGDICVYGGRDALRNEGILKFIGERFERVFITFDLDSERELSDKLERAGFRKKQSYLPVGLDQSGKRAIEGLIPDRIRSAVYADNADLVSAATSGTGQERKSAQSRLKRLLLEEFRRVARPGSDYEKFYNIARIINRALA